MSYKEEYEIGPQRGLSLNLKEIWAYKELFYFFTWRDIKIKYKQTVLGFLWAILQPLVMMLVFTYFFGKVLNVPSDGMPYPVFVFSGLLLWNLFSSGLSGAGNSMISNANIIKKIYFPRLIIPMSSVLVSAFDFCMALIVYVAILIYYQVEISFFKFLIFLPISLLITVVATFGMGSFLAALNVKYRDFRYIIPFILQIMLFVTPVIYPVSIIKQTWIKYLLALNPMTSAIDLLRSAIINQPLDTKLFVVSVFSSIVFFIIGLIYFRKTEAYFADLA